MPIDDPIISVIGVSKLFGRTETPDQLLPGCRSIDLDVPAGSTIGIVGESGSGKTTLGRCIAGLQKPDAGRILVRGKDIATMDARERREYRRIVQYVFQNPDTSLNPRMTVRRFVAEAFRNFGNVAPHEAGRRLRELVALVGLGAEHLDRYPHELSGGQKQRVGIMRALACDPKIVVLDEPTSALDVSVQAQVLTTLREIQSRLSVSFVLISHDIGVVRYMCERVAVMYLGRIVEQGRADDVIGDPRHPYTRALVGAVPRPIGRRVPDYAGIGAPTVGAPPRISECALRARCPAAMARCGDLPELLPIANGHDVACWMSMPGAGANGSHQTSPTEGDGR